MARAIAVELVGDSRNLERAFKRGQASAKQFDRSISRTSRGVRVGFGSIVKAGAALGGLSAAFSAVGSAVRAGISEFAESAKVTAQTEAVIRSTGMAANASSKQIEALASSLSKMSGVDDEVIQAGENMLLTFKNVRNEAGAGNDIFNQATKALLDMSVATGQDMTKAAVQLGKALNDPIKGMGALRRVGVTFDESQQKLIKRLVNTGRVMDAQKIILRELTTEFGGSAKAAGDTLPGRLNKLRNSFDELAARVIGVLVPTFEKLVKRAQAWISNAENQKRVVDAVKEAVDAVTGVLRTLKGVLDTVNSVTGSTTETIKLFVGVWAGFKATRLLSNLSTLATNITTVGTEAKTATGKVSGLQGALGRLGGIGPIVVAIEIAIHSRQIKERIQGEEGLDLPGGIRVGAGKVAQAFKDAAASIPQASLVRPILDISDQIRGATDAAKAIPMDEFVKAAEDLANKGARLRAAKSAGLDFKSALQEHIDIQNQIDDTITKAATRKGPPQSLINQWFDNRITRMLSRTEGIRSIQGQISRLQEIRALVLKRAAATKDVTRQLNLEDTAFNIWQQIIQKRGERADAIKAAADAAAQKAEDALAAVRDTAAFNVEKAGLTATETDNLAALRSYQAILQQQLAADQTNLDLKRELLGVQQQIQSIEQAQADAAKERAAKAKEAAAAARAEMIDRAQLAVQRTELTKTTRDDLARRRDLEHILIRMLQTDKNNLDLQSQLLGVQIDINNIQNAQIDAAKAAKEAAKEKAKAAAEAAKEAAKAAREKAKAAAEAAKEAAQAAAERRRNKIQRQQFQALGLTATGEERGPGVRALRRRLEQISQAAEGTRLSQKLAAQINRIGHVLGGGFGKVTRDTLQAIDQMIQKINDKLKQNASKLDLHHFPRAFAKQGAEIRKALSDATKPLRDPRYNAFQPLAAVHAAMAKGLRPPPPRFHVAGLPGAGLMRVPGGYVPAPVHVGTLNVYNTHNVGDLEQQITKRQAGRAHTRRGPR